MPAVLLQLGSTVLLNAGFSWIVGTRVARLWLRRRSTAPVDDPMFAALHRTEWCAAGLCVLALCAAMWAASAVMTGDSLAAAGGTLWMMLSQTSYGHAGLMGLVILVAIGGLTAASRKWAGCNGVIVALLIGFAASRASVSHAGENGVASVGFVVEWAHLLLIALWLGGVAVAGWLVLPASHAPVHDKTRVDRYLALLSRAATWALVGIVATGLYNALQRVGSVQNLMGNSYGTALLVKLVFIGLAVALGGYNKLIGFPSWAKSPHGSKRVIVILRIESGVLFGALVAAAFLATQQPPMAT